MKKIILLLLIVSNYTLYPGTYTQQDEISIEMCRLIGILSGLGVGLVGVTKYIQTIPWTNFTPERDEANRALMNADFIQWFKPFALRFIAIPYAMVIIPPIIGHAVATRLAALYIARKYKITYQEALKNI